MRIYPADVPDSTLSGERRVHAALARWQKPGATALHSLFLPEHAYKISSEIDFLLVLDEIVLVVEVKAASLSCRAGVWTYSDRQGHTRTSREGPFRQADSAMYALKERLRKILGDSWVNNVAFGWIVVTPDVDLASSFEWAEQTYIGRGPFSRAGQFESHVERAAAYWLAKQPTSRPLDAVKSSELVQRLRPDFEMVPSLSARASELDAAFVRLTDEQLRRLDLIAENDRILCVGGAGTGKSFLAAEATRRAARDGRAVALVCQSSILAAFLAGRLSDIAAQVVTADEFAELPTASLDEVVVDEAQDLMTFKFLDAIDRKLVGGLDAGHWAFFYDPNAQSRIQGAFDPAAEELLLAQGAVRAQLSRNCRNTREIAFQTTAHTGADVGVATAGSGPAVRFAPVVDFAEESSLLDAHLRELAADDVPPGAITILSVGGEWESSSAAATRASRKGRIHRVEKSLAASWPASGLTWCSVADFKGMENQFICVIDMPVVADTRAVELLYVAMTRARAGLWVATRPAALIDLKKLFEKNARTALTSTKEGNR